MFFLVFHATFNHLQFLVLYLSQVIEHFFFTLFFKNHFCMWEKGPRGLGKVRVGD